MKIGILALQGDVREHAKILRRLGVEPTLVKTIKDVEGVQGLILPGGESTTIRKLLKHSGLDKALRKKAREGFPLFGTCAGAIILSSEVLGGSLQPLELLDIAVERNSYGSQTESFEASFSIDGLQKDFEGVFIRSPLIARTGPEVKILATLNDDPILAIEHNVLVSTFHPELTQDVRIHQLFLDVVEAHSKL